MRPRRLLLAIALSLWPASAVAGQAGPPPLSPTDETAEDIPGELLVDFADDVDPDVIRDVFSRIAVTFAPSVLESQTRIERVRVVAERMDEVRGALSKDPRIDVVEPNARYWVRFEPNDPLLKEQWHL